MGSNGEIVFIGLIWKRSLASFKDVQKNRWNVYIADKKDKHIKSEGILFLLREPR